MKLLSTRRLGFRTGTLATVVNCYAFLVVLAAAGVFPQAQTTPAPAVARIGTTAAMVCTVVDAQVHGSSWTLSRGTARSFAESLPAGSRLRRAAVFLKDAQDERQARAYGAAFLRACTAAGWPRPTME
ncbi:hypothetical protein [Streptomyces sp. 135]|uniref:hypothetical protein n=1 Tax=Streptomyces sp. 135 TaxID=2838850 RepID=UPI001CBBAA5C|nr:hypothetical protein [Streptomyces sp. 135]